jgi:hypothetical protein
VLVYSLDATDGPRAAVFFPSFEVFYPHGLGVIRDLTPFLNRVEYPSITDLPLVQGQPPLIFQAKNNIAFSAKLCSYFPE